MRDGRIERIAVDIPSDPGPQIFVDCGSPLVTHTGGRYRHCISGHIHCVICHREAHRYRKQWTCGYGCKEKK